MTDRVYPSSNLFEDPGWLLLTAYYYMKQYEGIPEYEAAVLGVGLSGKLRDLLRMWGNMNWKAEV